VLAEPFKAGREGIEGVTDRTSRRGLSPKHNVVAYVDNAGNDLHDHRWYQSDEHVSLENAVDTNPSTV
jgi:hypothetical protein